MRTERVRTKVGQIQLFVVKNFDRYCNLSAAEIGRAYNAYSKQMKFVR